MRHSSAHGCTGLAFPRTDRVALCSVRRLYARTVMAASYALFAVDSYTEFIYLKVYRLDRLYAIVIRGPLLGPFYSLASKG